MAFSQDVIDAIGRAATAHKLDKHALQTVVDVESGGNAFCKVGGKDMPLILYEYHVFYRYSELTSAQRSQAVKRKLAAKSWGAIPYPKTYSARYNLLAKASDINEQAAYAACSWGVGQVLGENAKWLGFATPKDLAEQAISGIDGQIDLMLRFMKKRQLFDELNSHNWEGFARVYNGAGQVKEYARRMRLAYKRITGTSSNDQGIGYLRIGSRGEEVARLQRMLRASGFHLVVDGDFGVATDRQLRQFQMEQGLPVDGIAGPITLGVLEKMSGVLA